MGRVARIERDCGAGIEFLELSRKERLALVTYVASRHAENEAAQHLSGLIEDEAEDMRAREQDTSDTPLWDEALLSTT